ncbi:aspartyl-tRNA synthetase, cytoplasmic [Elysia marginata]|uniref:Aspartyl-tRNA synthetase, cytoplasmic n=1 Tax=Elysia marginata TaxID=1093978 RepID=A0AAV4HRU2_9GAST|nr:aspartyl-tRNA synthetase, cytoplasmic [Elysia marginata]
MSSTGESTDNQALSKKALKKQQKEAEKAAKKAEYKKENAQETEVKDVVDQSKGMYGVLPLNQSQERLSRRLHRVNELVPDLATQAVWVRGRLHTCRSKGKQCFFVVRQQKWTVQGVAIQNENISKQMIKFISGY